MTRREVLKTMNCGIRFRGLILARRTGDVIHCISFLHSRFLGISHSKHLGSPYAIVLKNEKLIELKLRWVVYLSSGLDSSKPFYFLHAKW